MPAKSGVTPPQAPSAPPDWSGLWLPDIKDQMKQIRSNPIPWTETAASEIAAMEIEEEAGRPRGLFVNCLPQGMPSWMLITHNAIEFLLTPGRVTILGEGDGNRLRRIYVDGRLHPDNVDPSFHGHSIGRWENDVLVVDTIAVRPETYIAVSEAVGLPNNSDVHITEHIHLTNPDTLVFEMTITAPHVMTAPWKTTRIFHRDHNPHDEIVEGTCLEGRFRSTTDEHGNSVFVPLPDEEP